jgi:hypothetical protein
MSYEVAALGQGALCGLLLRHYGINVLLDAHAVPTLEAAAQQQQPAASTAAASTAGAPSLQLSLQLTVPHYARLLQSVHQLHAVLLTNPWALLGLPALQQHLRSRGAELPLHTYATEPCLHSFQQLVQELQDAQHALQQQQQQHATASATSQQQQHVSAAPLPSVEQLQSVLDAVQAVRFGQQLQLPGCLGLTAEARPAGSSIGSCVWHLRHGSHRCALSPGTSHVCACVCAAHGTCVGQAGASVCLPVPLTPMHLHCAFDCTNAGSCIWRPPACAQAPPGCCTSPVFSSCTACCLDLAASARLHRLQQQPALQQRRQLPPTPLLEWPWPAAACWCRSPLLEVRLRCVQQVVVAIAGCDTH